MDVPYIAKIHLFESDIFDWSFTLLILLALSCFYSTKGSAETVIGPEMVCLK